MRQQHTRPRRTFRERLYGFMVGRNGADALCRALLILYLVLIVVNFFIGSWVIYAVEYILVIYTVFRMLSRNLAARRRENTWFLTIENSIKNFFKLQKYKWHDRKTHVYRKCPDCKKTLRLPRSKGKHTVKCPCCGHRFEVKI